MARSGASSNRHTWEQEGHNFLIFLICCPAALPRVSFGMGQVSYFFKKTGGFLHFIAVFFQKTAAFHFSCP